MENKKPTSKVISNYRKRRQQNQAFIIWGGAAMLALVGVILLVIWLTGPSKPLNSLFATETPTPTLTFTPTVTYTPTETPTITPTFTETPTGTPSAPFSYTIQEGDNLVVIAEKFGLADDGITLILSLNPAIAQASGIIYPGQEILIPNPGMRAPTNTPLPADIPRGTKLKYQILPGDTLAGIAAKFNSTVEEIIKENKIEDANLLQAYQELTIPVNIVTPTATRPPTSTSAPGTETAGTPQATPSLTATP
ncbi:MAG: LysM peptidoglycan-binding domain-containing protein [Chloroflexota bacterium]